MSWVSAVGSSEDGKGVSSPKAGGSRFRPEESRTAFPPTDRCRRGVEPRQASGPLSSSSPKPGLELVVLGPLVEGTFGTVFNHTPITLPARLGGAYHPESARLPNRRPVPSPVPRQVRPCGGNPGWFDKEGACELELDQGVGSGGTAKEVGAWRRKGHGRLVGNREVGVWRSKGGECGRAVGSGGTAKEVVVRRR